jgi:hypothetical protein
MNRVAMMRARAETMERVNLRRFGVEPVRLRGLGRVPRGVGQTVMANSNTSCSSWLNVTMQNYQQLGFPNIPALLTGLEAIWKQVSTGGNASDSNGTPFAIVDGSLHFLLTLSNGNTVACKWDSANLYVCQGNSQPAVTPLATSAATSTSTPYIVAGIVGVLVIGGLFYYAD